MQKPPREALTFSQAEGLEPLPTPLRLGEVPNELRNGIFTVIYESLSNCLYRGYVEKPWADLLRAVHVRFCHLPPDELQLVEHRAIPKVKKLAFELPFNRLFDLVEFILRQPACPGSLARQLNKEFETYRAAYRIVEPGPSVVPIASEEEGRAVQQAFADLSGDEFSGARKHLRDAGIYLGQPGKEAASVRESIHAVEAVCKVLGERPGATLTAALGRLRNIVPMHASFAEALVKLYSYTNDEKGIRHALLDDEAKVDATDAQFMFGACASFVSYLIGKARTAGIVNSK
jgi:hypothetical protein